MIFVRCIVMQLCNVVLCNSGYCLNGCCTVPGLNLTFYTYMSYLVYFLPATNQHDDLLLIIITIIIIIRHELDLDRPVSAWSNSLFKGLPSRHCPFGL